MGSCVTWARVYGLPEGMTICAVGGGYPKASVVVDRADADVMLVEQFSTECGSVSG